MYLKNRPLITLYYFLSKIESKNSKLIFFIISGKIVFIVKLMQLAFFKQLMSYAPNSIRKRC